MLAVVFGSDHNTLTELKAELICIPIANPEVRSGQPEGYRIRAFGKARFAKAKTQELLKLSLYNNAQKVHEQSFGPFVTKESRCIKWDGSSMLLESAGYF